MKKFFFRNFVRRNSIGQEERRAANKVIKKGILSDFLAADIKKFNGGFYVLKFEKKLI